MKKLFSVQDIRLLSEEGLGDYSGVDYSPRKLAMDNIEVEIIFIKKEIEILKDRLDTINDQSEIASKDLNKVQDRIARGLIKSRLKDLETQSSNIEYKIDTLNSQIKNYKRQLENLKDPI